MIRIFRCCLALGLSLGALPATLADDDISSRLQDRQALQQQIQSLKKKQSLTQAEIATLRTELQRREKALVSARKKLSQVEQQIGQRQQRLDELRARMARETELMDEQKLLLSKQIRAAYMQGRQDTLKLLLNQEDPSVLSRNLVYLDYLNRARAENIQQVKHHLQEMLSLEEAIKLEASGLRQLKHRQLTTVNDIEDSRAERQAIVARLESEFAERGHALQDMEKDLAELDGLITTLRERQLSSNPTQRPFSSMKGKLPWPSDGRLAHRFGSSRNKGSLRWQGVVIEAEPGTKITAVSHGEVVFADWFRNLGLLIIIDHGDGFMTLYGHNQALYKSPGDRVEAGELIASMGNTGGNLKTSLYFEIRKQGSPSDPSAWCRPRNLSRS